MYTTAFYNYNDYDNATTTTTTTTTMTTCHFLLFTLQVLECTPDPNQCGGTGGCSGALHELAFAWAEGGIALEATVPYLVLQRVGVLVVVL